MRAKNRYFTKAAYVTQNEFDGETSMTADEVLVEDDCPTFTGIYDHAGQRLYREGMKSPIGFRPYKET